MKKKQLLATLVMLSLMQGNVYAADQKILAQHERDDKPYTDYMNFGNDPDNYDNDQIAYIDGSTGGLYFNTWTFEKGASIDNRRSTSDWDTINFDAGYNYPDYDYTGIIKIGTEEDRKKEFIVYAPSHRSVIEMNGAYQNDPDAKAILTIEGGTGANLKFYGGNNKKITYSVISMYGESNLTVNAKDLDMQGMIDGEDNGAGGIAVWNDSHLDINLAGNFIANTSNGITVLEHGIDPGLGTESKKYSSIDLDASNIYINAHSSSDNNLNKNYYKVDISDEDVQGVGLFAYTYKEGSKVNVNLKANNNIEIKSDISGIFAVGNSQILLSTNKEDDAGHEKLNGKITITSDKIVNEKNSNASTIYAGSNEFGNANITLNSNKINILANNKSVWASGDGGTINLNGAVNINANSSNSKIDIGLFNNEKETTANQHIAIVAGVVGEDSVKTNHGEVNVNLKGTQDSQIIGDIVGARDGVVNINSDNYSGKLTIQGDILAGDGRIDSNKLQLGAVNLDLGKNGYLEGRVDDYQDADWKDSSNLEFFDPHFTDGRVTAAGTVNLTMGEGSTWNVTGQSWVTTLDGENSVIDLTNANNTTNAIHIGTLTGSNTFKVNLNADNHELSDMIYVGTGTKEKQILDIVNGGDLVDQMEVNERLRFATVAEAGGGFGDNYTVKGRGIRNVNFDIEYKKYAEDAELYEGENDSYNNADFGEIKPGTKYVEDNYVTGENSSNVYLIRTENDTPVVNPDEDLTDSGKTVINMSRANYKNAIYMDRLNKRLGEARYINGEEEQGMWVRIRHDRIGMDGEFRSQNTMYEMGYDEKQDCDNGERRVGFAIDYMDGSTTYSDIMGKGETKRYGLWLYDTWLGDKGHYADYVAKWGHLSNDFDIRDKESFERVTGDYSNNVFSVSAEYGRKKDIGNDWYIEPQAQLQLARVTGAEYTTTTQDTKVSVDGINSLIGRAGFRLGRDVDERSTVYIKADLLHEFLGDQTITATDATGSLRETFENKGTWYDVGFGFATALGKNSYAFMDFEKSFGNDNDETYQINAGVQWTF